MYKFFMLNWADYFRKLISCSQEYELLHCKQLVCNKKKADLLYSLMMSSGRGSSVKFVRIKHLEKLHLY